MTIQSFRYAPLTATLPIPTAPVNFLPDVFPINSGSATSGSTASVPANALVFANIITTGGNDSFTSVTDNHGNTYNVIQTTDASNAAIGLMWLVVPSSLPTGTTLTAVTSDGSQWGVGEAFYTTNATGGADVHSVHNDDSSNGTSSLSLSTGSLGETSEIIIGVFNTSGNGVTWTESSGFTTLHNDTFNITSYQVVSSSSSVTWNPSFTATGPFNCILGAFKAA